MPMDLTEEDKQQLQKSFDKIQAAFLRAQGQLEFYALSFPELTEVQEVADATMAHYETWRKHVLGEEILSIERCCDLAEDLEKQGKTLEHISFEGKANAAFPEESVGVFKQFVIKLLQSLRTLFGDIRAHFTASEKDDQNPRAKALLNRSFFITVPTTEDEAREIRQSKNQFAVNINRLAQEIQGVLLRLDDDVAKPAKGP